MVCATRLGRLGLYFTIYDGLSFRRSSTVHATPGEEPLPPVNLVWEQPVTRMTFHGYIGTLGIQNWPEL
jgi:hypothetical protein